MWGDWGGRIVCGSVVRMRISFPCIGRRRGHRGVISIGLRAAPQSKRACTRPLPQGRRTRHRLQEAAGTLKCRLQPSSCLPGWLRWPGRRDRSPAPPFQRDGPWGGRPALREVLPACLTGTERLLAPAGGSRRNESGSPCLCVACAMGLPSILSKWRRLGRALCAPMVNSGWTRDSAASDSVKVTLARPRNGRSISGKALHHSSTECSAPL